MQVTLFSVNGKIIHIFSHRPEVFTPTRNKKKIFELVPGHTEKEIFFRLTHGLYT
jgi:hypothetical protein